MSQLGFTFYPKDWWTSDSFYTLNPFERYIYLELLFMMYDNEGSIKNDRVKVERRLCTTIKEDVWSKITDLMVKDGDQLTHNSVNKRLKKTLVNRENGKKGGRPKSNEEKPKKPKTETQVKTQENPPFKREREREIESEKEIELEIENNSIPPIPPKGESERIDYSAFMDYFNETFKGKLSAVTKMTEKRKKAVKARISEHGKESVRTVYSNIVSSSFLLGGSNSNWTCDFDWIFKPSNYIKILEGNYNGKSNNSIQGTGDNSFRGTPENKIASRDALEELADAILGQH
ncbi:DUF1376 domain-containing protein [Bacteroides sp. 51]|uniref:DUF1376 domain-containing protein n=1 Tax=Bacteroides sp. 51 TaxID=2302938 RepID=UPI0013D8154A|nr:DUF1376 domain-containing protein [Bacteroides sp. 51]NDV81354.1 DUF1376 domain-containing protein [Bacteroides sp. 51]